MNHPLTRALTDHDRLLRRWADTEAGITAHQADLRQAELDDLRGGFEVVLTIVSIGVVLPILLAVMWWWAG